MTKIMSEHLMQQLTRQCLDSPYKTSMRNGALGHSTKSHLKLPYYNH